VDLLVGNRTGSKSMLLQVKTSANARRESARNPSGNHWEWDVGPQAGSLQGKYLFYVFVDLREDSDQSPEVFVVPSQVIVDRFKGTHFKRNRWWLYDQDAANFRENWPLLI